MFAKRVFADPEISMSSDVIHMALKRLKVFIQNKRWTLLRHKNNCKNINFEYYELGKKKAMEVRRLERIAKDLHICYMMAKIKEANVRY